MNSKMKHIGYGLVLISVILVVIKHTYGVTGVPNTGISVVQLLCSVFGVLFIVKSE